MSDTYWEHSQHTTYDKDCSSCYSENQVLGGLEGDFSFENVIKMVGNINQAINGKNPYKND